ncbi:MAG TPA: bifunctional hydroxymethylpyrimidine kinase/phosphomethylpyrimidine kinase [Alphaproteobacteria bacterium]|nr:bifunctional hydroxymethylpyrimidine kinase/phosphomethylpyrimidine kinase [Alphaproteobacteria bacterium]
MSGRILVVGGSDNTGAGGVQGDVKTVTALGGDAATAVTCLTVQDGEGIHEVATVAPDIIRRQIETVLSGRGVDAVKIGLLIDAASVDAVVEPLDRAGTLPIVIDAALRARDGRVLADGATVAHLKRRLVDRARVLVATVPDASVLAGTEIATLEDKRHVADMLRTTGAETIVLTDEDGPDDMVVDYIAGAGEDEQVLSFPRPRGRRVRGVSGAFATAVALFIGRGSDPATAIQHARMYVAGAVAHAPDTGEATDPLNHAYAALFEPLQRG